MKIPHLPGVLFAALAAIVPGSSAPADEIVRVFVLAGQSNMGGNASNQLLDFQATDAKTKDLFKHLRTGDDWTVRKDVFLRFPNRMDCHGKLTAGLGWKDKTGPELEFGHMVGDFFEEPVLLIKFAGGGDTLFKEFRPPSAGMPDEEVLDRLFKLRARGLARVLRREPTMDDFRAEFGSSYRKMMGEVKATLDKIDRLFPQLKGKTPEITGFVWFHGSNDSYKRDARAEYAENMKHFIKDVCRDLGYHRLPFVIAALGTNGSKEPKPHTAAIQSAQLSMNDVREFEWNVIAFRTDELVDKAAEELFPKRKENPREWSMAGAGSAMHYYGSPIWYNRIGRDMGVIMVELLK